MTHSHAHAHAQSQRKRENNSGRDRTQRSQRTQQSEGQHERTKEAGQGEQEGRLHGRMIPPAFERRDMTLLESEPKVVGGRVEHQSKAREPRGTPNIQRRPCRPTAPLMRPWTAVARGQ